MSEIVRIYLIYYIYILCIIDTIYTRLYYRGEEKKQRMHVRGYEDAQLTVLFYMDRYKWRGNTSIISNSSSRTCHRTITYSNYLLVYLIVAKDERKRSCAQFTAFAIVARAHHRRSIEISRSRRSHFSFLSVIVRLAFTSNLFARVCTNYNLFLLPYILRCE